MKNEKMLDDLYQKLEQGNLTDKQKSVWHDKVLKLDLEEILAIFPDVFKAGILDKRDGQALFEELLQRPDRVSLYHLVFECLEEKANFLSTKQIDDLKSEVITLAPIDVAFDLVFFLKNTKFLGREEIEHIAFRVLTAEHVSCYADAFYVLSDLDVFEPEDLEAMWQRTLAIGDVFTCIQLAEALSDEDVVDKKDVQTLFDECLQEIEALDLKNDDDKLEAEENTTLLMRLLGSFLDKKFFTPTMLTKAKNTIKTVFKDSDEEIEKMNSFANILGKNPFLDEELSDAKKRFMKKIKDAVKTCEGVVEIINNQKGAKKQEPDFENMFVPAFASPFDEEFVIEWKNVFSSADKKTLKELALKTKNIDIYEAFVIIWQEGIDELDELFGECGCDCEECSGCHC